METKQDRVNNSFVIRYDERIGKFKIMSYPAKERNGLGMHVGRNYTPKAVMDILRRCYGKFPDMYLNEYGYSVMDYEASRFVIDRMSGFAKRELERAIEAEERRMREKVR